jgi:hypothetical protein
MSTVAKNTRIEFFFVGVGKCGTSWIFEVARKKHLFSVPKIKEPYLIDQPESRQARLTQSLYSSFDRMADFSNLYYWDPDNAKKIFAYNPNAKIIVTIRKPSDRIVSHFKFAKRNGDFSALSLAQYLDSGDPVQLIARSDYRPLIERYTSVFGDQNVLVLALEHLKCDPQDYLNRLTEFSQSAPILMDAQDKAPVLKQARARSPLAAKLAKQTAVTLRKLGMLSLLGSLKDSRLVRNFLYSERGVQTDQEDYSFGQSAQKIACLDDDYIQLLRELNYTIPAHDQNDPKESL